jgi:CRP-like cAMP-binding protein
MDHQQPSHRPTRNLILAALPAAEFDRLTAQLEPLSLPQGRVLYEHGQVIDQVYFPDSGMVSLLSTTSEGAIIEVAMVGNEGMLGMPIVWGSATIPYQVTVQIAGTARAVPASLLQAEVNRQGLLHDLLLRYTYILVSQISQSAVCNRFHTIEQRLCRWLLVTHDRTQSNEYPLTQDFLSHMLGSSRQRVNAALRALQKKRLIGYARGQIAIVDRRGLESTSCECYNLVRQAYDETSYLT